METWGICINKPEEHRRQNINPGEKAKNDIRITFYRGRHDRREKQATIRIQHRKTV